MLKGGESKTRIKQNYFEKCGKHRKEDRMLFQLLAHENYNKGVSCIVYSKDEMIVSITILNEVRLSDLVTNSNKINFMLCLSCDL